MFAQGPVDVLDPYSHLLGLKLEDRRPLRRVVDVLDAPLAEFDVGDECCHATASLG